MQVWGKAMSMPKLLLIVAGITETSIIFESPPRDLSKSIALGTEVRADASLMESIMGKRENIFPGKDTFLRNLNT